MKIKVADNLVIIERLKTCDFDEVYKANKKSF